MNKVEAEAKIETLGVGSLTVNAVNVQLQLVKVDMVCPNGQSRAIEALLDTGANVTALPFEFLCGFGLSERDLSPELKQAKAANGAVLKVAGTLQFKVKFREVVVETVVFVIRDLEKPILSMQVLKELKLIPEGFPFEQVLAVVVPEGPKPKIITGFGPELDEVVNEFPKVFDGQCKVMKGKPYHIDLLPGAVPVNTGASRMVAEPYMPALRKELDSLVAQGIIEPIEEASEWLHPIVIVPKKGSSEIRMCVDFTRLNRFVKRPVNPQLTPWEVVCKIPRRTKHFAVFDALKGYHQVELDEESRALTTFMTPFGRYRYLRLPFGLNSAGDEFTLRYGRAVDDSVQGRRITEDTVLLGQTTHELLENARKFFRTCDQNGITLNLKKVQWDKTEVVFGGYLINSEGYHVDPALSEALREFPTLKSQTDVRSFFGLANQTCNFSSEISELLAPLKSLLKKGTKFQWLPEYETAFQKAREHLSSPKVLAYYNPNRRTRLIADASRLNGLGFVLKQEVDPDVWKTVQAGSRFLTPAETRYAMIELELLAIAWACRKCAMFVEGLPRDQLEIWTDHQPLVPILSRYTLPEIENKRLQRLRMKVDHLQFTVKWVKGKDNVEADCL